MSLFLCQSDPQEFEDVFVGRFCEKHSSPCIYIYNCFLAGMKNDMQINIRHPPPEVFLEVFFLGGLDINFKYWDV